MGTNYPNKAVVKSSCYRVLKADLTSLYETLEKTESELAKVKSEKEELSFRNKNQTDIITTLQSKKWQGKEIAYGKTAKKQP